MINYDEIEIKDRRKDTELLEDIIKKADEDIDGVIATLSQSPDAKKQVEELKAKKAIKDEEARLKREELIDNEELSDAEFAEQFLDVATDLDLYNEFLIGEVNDILRETIKDLQTLIKDVEKAEDTISMYCELMKEMFLSGSGKN